MCVGFPKVATGFGIADNNLQPVGILGVNVTCKIVCT